MAIDRTNLLKYAIVGATGVAVNTLLLFALTERLGVYYIISGIIASEASIINNFILNDMWTFKGNHNKHHLIKRFISYQVISVIGTIILVGLMYVLTENMNIYYIYANWCGIIIVFIINYILNKHLTWGSNDA